MKIKYVVLILLLFLLVGCNKKDFKETWRNSTIYLNDTKLDNSKLHDSNYDTTIYIQKNDKIKLINKEDFRYLYVITDEESAKATLTYNDKEIETGKDGFIHEFIDLKENTNEIEMTFKDKTALTEIYVFKENEELPWWVQKWEPAYEKADLLLISAHSDDEHLFFAGLIPTYVARGYKVQVAHFTKHTNNIKRNHELLDGLWHAGVTHYPITSEFPDLHSHNLQKSINDFAKEGISEDDLIKYQVELIRRFHPEVVVTHSVEGEYNHGQHMLCNYTLQKALEVTDKKKVYTDIPYKAWKPKKVYFHSIKPSNVYLDIDIPLDYYNGKTAFQVSQEAFKYHQSQHTGWVYEWIYGDHGEITKSTQITKLNPNYYMLYYTNVGNDKEGNDLFEHIKTASI